MKKCELCKFPARTFCESDQASLCWDCDAKVHEANFLVARHSRTLLCHACQSPTPWKASGGRLGANTVSLCEICAGGMEVTDTGEDEESEGDNDDEIDTEDDDLDDDGDGDDDGDNQVVPWSSTPPPPAASSSSSEESVSRCNHGEEDISESATSISFKRRREDHSF